MPLLRHRRSELLVGEVGEAVVGHGVAGEKGLAAVAVAVVVVVRVDAGRVGREHAQAAGVLVVAPVRLVVQRHPGLKLVSPSA